MRQIVAISLLGIVVVIAVFGLTSNASAQYDPRSDSSGSTNTSASAGRSSSSGSNPGSSRLDLSNVGSQPRNRGENRQPGQFVGSDSQDATNFLKALGMGGGLQNFRSAQRGISGNRGSNRSNQPGNRSRGGRGNTQSSIRTIVRVGFDYPKATPSDRIVKIATRLEKVIGKLPPSSIQVSLENETATLRGVVATDHDRRIAEQLVRFEAGIWHVKNELTLLEAIASPVPESTKPVAPVQAKSGPMSSDPVK